MTAKQRAEVIRGLAEDLQETVHKRYINENSPGASNTAVERKIILLREQLIALRKDLRR